MRLLTAFWLFLITAISVAPLRVKVFLHSTTHWHDAFHLTAFFVTGLLAFSGLGRNLPAWLVSVLLIAYCGVLEWLEAVIYHNPFEWHDLLVDTLAIALAWLCISPIRTLLSRQRLSQRPRPY